MSECMVHRHIVCCVNKEFTIIRDDTSGELYSHLPAHSATHSNSDAMEGRWNDLC